MPTVSPPSSAWLRSCAQRAVERKGTAIRLIETIGGITSCADEGHQLRGRRPPAHQLQRRGPGCRLLTHTLNQRSSHSDRGATTFETMRRLRHPIEWRATFFYGIVAESLRAVCKTVRPRDGTTCPRSGAVRHGLQASLKPTCTGHQAFGHRLFVRIGIRASEYQVAAESGSR